MQQKSRRGGERLPGPFAAGACVGDELRYFPALPSWLDTLENVFLS